MTASLRLHFDFHRLNQNVAKRCGCLYLLSVLHLLPDLVTICARVVLPFRCFSLVVRVVLPFRCFPLVVRVVYFSIVLFPLVWPFVFHRF